MQYRAPVSLAELPEAILEAQARFDGQVKAILECMAEVFRRGIAPPREPSLAQAYEHLSAAINQTYGGRPTPRAAAVLSLSSQVANPALAFNQEVSTCRSKLL